MFRFLSKQKLLFTFLGIYLVSIISLQFLMNQSDTLSTSALANNELPIKKQIRESLLGILAKNKKEIRNSTANESSQVAFGLAVEPITSERIKQSETKLGYTSPLIMLYSQWGNKNTANVTPLLTALGKTGKTPIITWEPWDPTKGVNQPTYNLKSIAQGRHDTYIRNTARAIKAYKKPVFMRFAHEMNGNWYPWGGSVNGNSAKQYIATHKYVYSLFEKEGVSNVTWIWSPNAGNVPERKGNDLTDYYPGDSYVDWVGIDGYNFGTSLANGPGWQSFDAIFADSYDKVTRMTDKPIMLAEMASSEQGGNKAAWIKDALTKQLPTKYTEIRAIVWFDIASDNQWQIDSSTAVLNTLKKSLKQQHFSEKLEDGQYE